jgi:hypothetical protein
VLTVFAFAAASISQCTVERAHYVLRHYPAVTAYFRDVDSGRDWPSGVALSVHHKSSGKTFWWLPWLGGTDGLQNVASTQDVTKRGWQPPNPDGGPRPYGNRQYLGFDSAYNIVPIPRRGSTAPTHMLFPDSAGSGDTVFRIKQFFDLVSCAPARPFLQKP